MPIALFALALASFAVGTAEFVISGLLPDLSAGLGVSIPAAGLLVTAYAFAVAVGGPILAVLTARFPRKPMILAMMAIFALGQVLCAVAPNYQLLMAARVFVAASHGLFFGIGSISAANLVEPRRRGMALSIFFSGITLANLIGMPGGTAIGNLFGWRITFWTIGGIGMMAVVAMALLLPADGPPANRPKHDLRREFGVLKHQQVWLSYLVIMVLMTGVLALGTYQVPLLEQVGGISDQLVPAYLLLAGAGSVIGVFIGGRLSDWKLMPTLVGILVASALVQAAFVVTIHHPVLLAAHMFVFGIVGFSFNAPLQSRILEAAKAAPNLAATLISTAFNIGIGGGAWLGAVLLANGFGYEHLPLVAACCSLAAAAIAVVSWSFDPGPRALAA